MGKIKIPRAWNPKRLGVQKSTNCPGLETMESFARAAERHKKGQPPAEERGDGRV